MGGLRFVDVGVDDATFNGVIAAPAEPAGFDAAAADVVAYFRARGRPFYWRLGLQSEPPDAAAVLARHGLAPEKVEPGMWLDLHAPATAPAPVAGLEVRPVTTDELVRQWADVWGCGAPASVTDRWYALYAALPYGADTSLQMFVGYLDGIPAATVYVFLAAGVAAIEYVVTRPEYRRRGIGAAMTSHALGQARAAGFRTAVLTASPLGEAIYHRLGFRTCATVTTYIGSG